MKIYFVRHSLLNRGGDKMIVAYASFLAETGHHVVIKANLVDTVFELSPRVILEPLKYSGKVGTILSLLFNPVDSDIVIADIIPLAFILSVRNVKRVLYFAQDYNENTYHNLIQKIVIRCLYALSFKLLKIPVIAVSDTLAHIFAARFATESKVVHNGVDLNTFYFDPDENLINQKGTSKVILFFSRRDYRKGFDLALATIEKLVSNHFPEVTVWTVGEHLVDGELSCTYRDFGYVSENNLRRIMSSADVFLYPSRNEGFGLMVLEAFACKCAVVTTDAIPFAIDGENALVAPIENVDALVTKVSQLLTKADLAHELTDKASKFVLSYSLDSSAKEFESSLQSQLEL